MGGDISFIRRLNTAAGVALVIFLLTALYLNIILSTALAGTETGEFCPDCPDWTDLDGWLAKKDAYEKAQLNGVQQNVPAINPSTTSAKVEDEMKGYPVPELLTAAKASRNGMVVLDVRPPKDYQSGHISGARNLYWKDLQKDGRLDIGVAKRALQKAGVNDSDRILICGGPDEGPFYAFWALCYLGHENLSLLDGGLEAAVRAGTKLDTHAPSVPESNYTIHILPWLLVTADNLDSFLNLSDLEVLDARDFVDYGKSKLTNAAIPLSSDKFYENYKIKDAASLDELLNRRSLNKEGIQLVYGTPQAYSLFYSLMLTGYNATLLEGDWWKETRWAVSEIK
jgi:thiosulfate/3-mercaptopyruvate sulfurtransferase